jgi:hypothetical protein
MAPVTTGEGVLHIGAETFVEGPSPSTRYAAVFEDDGDVAYFYALDIDRPGNRIVDAMHVYNAANVIDKDSPYILETGWPEDGLNVGLYIDRQLYALFDFQSRRGYCRTGFGTANRKWSLSDHSWSDIARTLIG